MRWRDILIEIEYAKATLHGHGYFNYIKFPYQDHVLPRINDALMKGIQLLNPCKDRFLSHELHRLADWYDPPSEQWDASNGHK